MIKKERLREMRNEKENIEKTSTDLSR